MQYAQLHFETTELKNNLEVEIQIVTELLNFCLQIFLKDFIYLILESWRQGEREGEKHQCAVASPASPTGEPGPQPGHVP